MSNVVIIILLMTGIVLSCIDPFTPETTEYEELLIIEALITDNPIVPAKVSISRTYSLDRDYERDDIMESGAVVLVVCEDENAYSFVETSPGIYNNIADTIKLESGKLYKLMVETSDGNTFESDFESYKPSPTIDSITYAHEIIKTSDLESEVEGLQFYAHSKGTDAEPLYLRWILDATYKYAVPYNSDYIWTGSSLEEFQNDDSLICWKNIKVKGIYIGDSYGMIENRVAYAPLNFVSQIGDQLMLKYSLHAIQLSISESSYRFWYYLNKLINETGGLYETQPFRIEGNIRCTSDPGVKVAGVFEVAGVTELRVFATRPAGLKVYPTYCELDTVGVPSFPWYAVRPGSYIMEPDDGLYLTSEDYCFICTQRGGTTQEPDYWQ